MNYLYLFTVNFTVNRYYKVSMLYSVKLRDLVKKTNKKSSHFGICKVDTTEFKIFF